MESEAHSRDEITQDDALVQPIRIVLMRRRETEDEGEFIDIEHESVPDDDVSIIDVENDDQGDNFVDVEVEDEVTVDVESNIAQAPNVIHSDDSTEPGVENPIIRLENPHFSDCKKEEPVESRKRTFSEMQEDDSGQNCPVCLEPWTTVGPHRLCSLKCGHLFGKSCVIRWLSTRTRSACPQCNSKTRKADIRELYATKLVALDTSEVEELRALCSRATEEKRELEKQLSYQKEMTEYYKKLAEKSAESASSVVSAAPTSTVLMLYYKILATVSFVENSCRVLAFSPHRDLIVISQKSTSILWPGFGIRILSPVDWSFSNFYLLHKKMIRDLAFHPENTEQLLSVAFDNSVKIFDIVSRTELSSFSVESPMWCCSWDPSLSNFFYCGSSRGEVSAYNIQSPTETKKFEMADGDTVPVVAVAKSQTFGFLLCCRVHSVIAYVKDSTHTFKRQVLQVCSGPFVAMCYDDIRGMLVLACRPTEEYHFAYRHASYRVTFTNGVVSCEEYHVFLAGNAHTRISRPCLLTMTDNSYYFAYNESKLSIWGWCLENRNKVIAINVNKPVTDLLAVVRNNGVYLLVLTTSNVKCYALT